MWAKYDILRPWNRKIAVFFIQKNAPPAAINGLMATRKDVFKAFRFCQFFARPSETVEPQRDMAVRFPHIPANLFRKIHYISIFLKSSSRRPGGAAFYFDHQPLQGQAAGLFKFRAIEGKEVGAFGDFWFEAYQNMAFETIRTDAVQN